MFISIKLYTVRYTKVYGIHQLLLGRRF